MKALRHMLYKKNKCAILLRGAISKTTGVYSRSVSPTCNDYVNFTCVKKSIDNHIIKPNSNYDFDFFIHSWNPDLKNELLDLYPSKLSEFENNIEYEDFLTKIRGTKPYSQCSQLLSISKVCKLLLKFNQTYDYVIIYRPDVLLWKNLIINENFDGFIVNNHANLGGDFHICFNFKYLHSFSQLFDAIDQLPSESHHMIKYYIQKIINVNMMSDDITPGIDQEVVRKLKCAYSLGNISEDLLNSFGLTIDEIMSYSVS